MSTDVLRRVNFFRCSSVALRCAPSPAHPGVRFVLTRTRRALLHRQVCVHQRRHRWLRRRVRDDMPQAVQCHADLLARTQRLVAGGKPRGAECVQCWAICSMLCTVTAALTLMRLASIACVSRTCAKDAALTDVNIDAHAHAHTCTRMYIHARAPRIRLLRVRSRQLRLRGLIFSLFKTCLLLPYRSLTIARIM